MPANNLSENLENLSQSQGYKKFLGMPLIGSIASRKKKEEKIQKENKDSITIPKKLLSKLLNQQQDESQIEPMQTLNKDAEILTNIYNVMRMDHQIFMKNMIADKKFDKKIETLKESRTKELIDLFSGKKVERERKNQVKREIEELKKKLNELEERGKKLKEEGVPVPETKPVTPPKPGTPAPAGQVTTTPTAPTVPPTKPPVSAPPAAAPSAAKPSVTAPPAAANISAKVPSKAPTATPAAQQAQTATKAPTVPAVAAGTAIVAGAVTAKEVSAKIARGESRGEKKESYTQANIVGNNVKEAQIIKGNIDVTTQKPFDKNLTEMTIPEVIDLAKRRYQYYSITDPKTGKKVFRGGSAMGKYQFIPGTLEAQAKYLYGENWKTKVFDETAQEDLNESFIMSNAERLKKAGVPVTDASLYMMHFFGNPKQTKMVLESPDDFPMKDILGDFASKQNPSIAKMSVSEYKKHLMKKGFDFKEIGTLKTRSKDIELLQPTNNGVNVGDKIDQTTKEYNDLQRETSTLVTPSTTVLNTINNVTNGANIYETPSEDKSTPALLNNQYK